MTKIEALEKTIYNLENEVYGYNWANPTECNCGILCASVIGRKVQRTEVGESSIYSESSMCMVTGLKMPFVFRELKQVGFTHDELRQLEFINNEQICDRAGIEIIATPQYERYTRSHGKGKDDKRTVIKYLKAWVEILKEEKMIEEPEVKRSVASKVQSERWADQTKKFTELIPVVEEVADCEVKIISD